MDKVNLCLCNKIRSKGLLSCSVDGIPLVLSFRERTGFNKPVFFLGEGEVQPTQMDHFEILLFSTRAIGFSKINGFIVESGLPIPVLPDKRLKCLIFPYYTLLLTFGEVWGPVNGSVYII